MIKNAVIFGIEIEPYAVCNAVGLIAVFVYILLTYKEKMTFLGGVSVSVMEKRAGKRFSEPGAYALAELLILTVCTYIFMFLCNEFWSAIATPQYANFFGNIYFYPFLLALVCLALKIDPLRQLDSIAPAMVCALFFAKIGCFFAGCCYGVEMTNSFYHSIIRQRFEFPVQLVEAIIALIIFFVLLSYKRKNEIPGSVYPVFVLLYSATRFFTEFARDDFQDLVWILNTYHFQCIGGVILAVAELAILSKYARSLKHKKKKSTKKR